MLSNVSRFFFSKISLAASPTHCPHLSLTPAPSPVNSSWVILHLGTLKVVATDQSAPINTHQCDPVKLMVRQWLNQRSSNPFATITVLQLSLTEKGRRRLHLLHFPHGTSCLPGSTDANDLSLAPMCCLHDMGNIQIIHNQNRSFLLQD